VVLATADAAAGLRQQGRLILAVMACNRTRGMKSCGWCGRLLSGHPAGAQPAGIGSRRPERAAAGGGGGVGRPAGGGIISDANRPCAKRWPRFFPLSRISSASFIICEKRSPIWEADRHAQKELRKRVRGVRKIEREVEDRTDRRPRSSAVLCAVSRRARR